MPIPIWDHLSIPIPPNTGSGAIYIRLTAGQSGPGGFNQGLLINETVSGSAPLVQATAVIAVGPLAGKTVHLINTEEAFIRATTVSGTLQYDQIQRITGSAPTGSDRLGSYGQSSGAMRHYHNSSQSGTTGGGERMSYIDFDSSRVVRSGTETRPKNVSATWYLRIR